MKETQVLQLNSSIRGSESVSTRFANQISNRLASKGAKVAVRDLSVKPVTVYSSQALGQVFGPDQSQPIAQEYNELIDEVLSADILVLGVPMYNFSIPVQLKTYFDAIAKKGATFNYTETGPKGLLKASKAYVVLSRGGKYKENGLVFQEDFLNMYLKFLGVKEVEYIYVEGINMGEEAVKEAISLAQKAVESLAI